MKKLAFIVILFVSVLSAPEISAANEAAYETQNKMKEMRDL